MNLVALFLALSCHVVNLGRGGGGGGRGAVLLRPKIPYSHFDMIYHCMPILGLSKIAF